MKYVRATQEVWSDGHDKVGVLRPQRRDDRIDLNSLIAVKNAWSEGLGKHLTD